MTSIMARPCAILTFLCIFTISGLWKEVDSFKSTHKSVYKEVLDDLPQEHELELYLTGLERIVNFATEHKNYVDIHLGFGIFLINVNLRNIIQRRKIPEDIKTRLVELVHTADKLMSHFQRMVDSKLEGPSPDESPELSIAGLFYKNERSWVRHLVQFRPNLLMGTKFYSSEELQDIYSDWPEYVDKVFDFEHSDPSPAHSLKCLAQLDRGGRIGLNTDMHGAHCVSHYQNTCPNHLFNGTEYGYALVHRLLYILMGRYSRGCSALSESLDKLIMDDMCRTIYNEAEYIAQHESRMPYLAMGQIAICSLEGHVQFIRQSWINPLLDFQTEYGCFGRADMSTDGRRTNNEDDPEWQIHIRGPIMGGLCNTPTTGVATSMLAAAIRLILETGER